MVNHTRKQIDRLSFHWMLGVAASLGVLMLVLPTVIVMVTSFTSGYSLKFPPPGYSTRWYEACFLIRLKLLMRFF